MKILNLLRIPIIKWSGIALVLYFALFANKENPDSLGNRLSKENVQKNMSDMREKSKFIVVNVKAAQDAAKEKEAQQKPAEQQSNTQPAAQISIEDIEEGTGKERVGCSDEVELSYTLYTKEGKEIKPTKLEKITIGSKKNQVIEKNILGMKHNGIRNINIPQQFKTNEKNLTEVLKFNDTDLKYLVTILSIRKSGVTSNSCY